MVSLAPGSEFLNQTKRSHVNGTAMQDQAFQVDFRSGGYYSHGTAGPTSYGKYESNPSSGKDTSQAHTKYEIGLNKNFILRNFAKLLQFSKLYRAKKFCEIKEIFPKYLPILRNFLVLLFS
jgi:hypothetical protein